MNRRTLLKNLGPGALDCSLMPAAQVGMVRASLAERPPVPVKRADRFVRAEPAAWLHYAGLKGAAVSV